MQFDRRSVKRIIDSVHATEKLNQQPNEEVDAKGVYRFVLLAQITPVSGSDAQRARADIYTMDMEEVYAYDVELWTLDNALFGESAPFMGTCVYDNYKFWYVDPIRGVPFYNDSGLVIPKYGAIQITTGTVSFSSPINVKQPDSDGVRHPGLILINSASEIPVASYGIANVRPSMVAKINTGDGAVAIGDDVGPKSGSFDLWAGGKGFTLRAAAGTGLGIVEANDNVLEIVRVTSSTPDGSGFYDGVVQRFNPISLLWETLFTCKVLDANG